MAQELVADVTTIHIQIAPEEFMGGQELESRRAVKARILALVDYSHAAFAELLENLVPADSLIDHDDPIVTPRRGWATSTRPRTPSLTGLRR